MDFPFILPNTKKRTIINKRNVIMANILNSVGSMGFNVTSGTLKNATSTLLNDVESMLIHGKHKGVRFYYTTSGGGIFNVITKSVINGAVSELSSLAKNAFNSLLTKKVSNGMRSANPSWASKRIEAIKDERSKNYGQFPVNNGSAYVFATDCQGYRCRDALMLGIPLDDNKTVFFSQRYRNEDYITGYSYDGDGKRGYKANDIPNCDHLVWFDSTAIVSVESSKNLVITQVQGRDYSRKELVSNGDVNISVSGYITSLYPDVYPQEEVKKLRQILRYKGIIKVNNIILDSWDIDKIIIKDFNFPQEEGGKSVQRYSFNAVAVQPVMLSEVTEDSIQIITQPFESSDTKKKSKWSDMIDSNIESLKKGAGSLLDVGLSKGSEALNNTLYNKNR